MMKSANPIARPAMEIFQSLALRRRPQHPVSGPPDLRRLALAIQRWGLVVAAVSSLAMITGAPVSGQVRVASGSDAGTGATMVVPINKSQTLRVDRAIGKAVIGNEAIADVLPVSLSSIYVLGKAIGSTNLSLFDRQGGLIAVVDIVVGPDTQSLKRKLAELLPAEAIGVTVSNDSVVLDGRMSSAVAAERAAMLAETFAPKKVINMMSVGTPQQIMLEVRFSEMSRGTVKQLGIRNVSFGNPLTNAAKGAVLSPGFGSGSPGGGFTAAINLPLSNLNFTIDALEQKGLARTLAQPNLIALSGETASFLAGGEFPVPTSVTTNGQVGITFKQFGVSLKFTPTLLEDGLVNLVVEPEVSSLDASAGVSINGTTIPGLKTRKARTTLELRDGQAFAMAGLIQTDFADTVSAVPLLSRVPIIGALFRSTSFNRKESELVMIVTPRIVRPVPAGVLSQPSDFVKDPSDIDLFMLGKTEDNVSVRPPLPLPGPPSDLNRARVPTPDPAKPGGIEGEFGHIVK
jgi:pilus assembly protein CpaC